MPSSLGILQHITHCFFFHRSRGTWYCASGKENIWEREFHQVLGFFENLQPTLIYQDNTATINLSTGGTCHKRSKHFGLEFDIFREYVALGELKIEFLATDEMVADLLTKPLAPGKFTEFRAQMMGGPEVQNHFSRRR